MKHKVCELEGALLDAAVAKAEGWKFEIRKNGEIGYCFAAIPDLGLVCFWPSSSWDDGMPIVERECIALIPPEPIVSVEAERAAGMQPSPWLSWQWGDPARRMSHGPTPLVAGMRSYVASRFGEEVELP
jgi:Protein of unknown function (DUF2591)